jgi:hypothetical protein
VKLVALLVGAVLAFGVVWLAGEQHRENCIRSGKAGCSVLPWDAGTSARQASSGKLTREGCVMLRLANEQALTEDDVQPIPPECD